MLRFVSALAAAAAISHAAPTSAQPAPPDGSAEVAPPPAARLTPAVDPPEQRDPRSDAVDCNCWYIVPTAVAAAALLGGLLAGAIAISGTPHESFGTSASYTIAELREDHDSARLAAVVADGFFIASGASLAIQFAVVLPICLKTKLCEGSARDPVRVGRKGELVFQW